MQTNLVTEFEYIVELLRNNLPIVFLISGILLALLIDFIMKKFKDRVVIKRLKENFKVTKEISFKWLSVKIISASLRKYLVFWFLLISVYLSMEISFNLQDPLKKNLNNDLITLILLLYILSFTWATADITSKIIHARAKVLASTSIFVTILKIGIYFIGVILVLNVLKQDISPFIATLGIAGLAVALALQDTLSNFFAGIYLVASRQIKPGDFVKLETGELGEVFDINWRSTTLRTRQNFIVIVPNSKMGQATITNYHLPSPSISVLTQIGVAYDSNLKHVERVCIDEVIKLAENSDLSIDLSVDPSVRFHTFADFSINFDIFFRVTDYPFQFLARHEFIKAIHERFKKEGIEIPFPIRTLHIKNYEKLEI